MKDVTGLFVVFAALMGSVGGIEPSSGYCIGNQCFTVFQHPSNFATARDQCEERSGHLMTVRSSVSQDILLILLGNFPGKYWIGLHRPTGCPDTDAKLRGYEWVTEDRESDFYNWETFDDSCASPRCITVSQEDAFKWTQEPCSEAAVGFLCEYSFHGPCNSLPVKANESVIYRIPMGYEGKDLLSLPPGSTATRMPSETRYVCFSEQWLEAPWSCEIQEGGCEHKCAVDPKHVPFCYCPRGHIINPANKVTCEAVADDPCLHLNCQHACYNNGDSYTCVCEHGFKLGSDNRSCVDFNDCKDERQCPGKNFMCVNTVGGFECVCEDGYKMKGEQCHDVDECASAPCEHMCDNLPGGYKCSCYDGYKADPESPDKCVRYCGVQECPAECDPNNHFHCFCPEGYILEERVPDMVCIDIDECRNGYCDQGCKNLFGGYICSCSAGFTLVDEYMCVKNDVDDTDEGSGAATTPTALTPTPTPSAPHPDPTPGPSGVTVGVFVGIIVCTVFFTVLLVFLAHHFLCGRRKTESSGELKAPEGEAHGLHRVKSDVS